MISLHRALPIGLRRTIASACVANSYHYSSFQRQFGVTRDDDDVARQQAQQQRPQKQRASDDDDDVQDSRDIKRQIEGLSEKYIDDRDGVLMPQLSDRQKLALLNKLAAIA